MQQSSHQQLAASTFNGVDLKMLQIVLEGNGL